MLYMQCCYAVRFDAGLMMWLPPLNNNERHIHLTKHVVECMPLSVYLHLHNSLSRFLIFIASLCPFLAVYKRVGICSMNELHFPFFYFPLFVKFGLRTHKQI